MYKTLTVPADNDTTAEKEVNKLFTRLGLFTWQIKGFSPVHDKETEFIPGTPQYKVIVLLTADQVEKFCLPTKSSSEYIKELSKGIPQPPAAKKAAPKKAAAKKATPKKAAEKKLAALAKKPADPVKEKTVK